MKKILGISLVSVLAVSPMMAGAANVTTIANVTANDDLATTSYVQGAYNVLGAAVNTKQDQLSSTAGNIVTTVKTAVSETAAGASDTSLVTEKAVFDAIDAAKQIIGGDTTAITNKIGNGEIDVRDATTVVGALNELDTDLATAESAITKLNGDANTAGSVAKTVADAVADERSRASGVENGLMGALNTLDGRVTANTNAINTLNGDASTTGSVDNKISTAISNVNTTTSGLNARVTANENAISTINGKTISYVTTWNQDAATTITKTIAELPPVQGQGEEDDEGEEESGN